MGKRIKRLKFLKEVEEEVVTLCKCDGCGRIIREAKLQDETEEARTFEVEVAPDMKGQTCWSIRAMHREWGNDSVDSIVTFHSCSILCTEKILHQIMNKDGYDTSGRFEIEAYSAEEV